MIWCVECRPNFEGVLSRSLPYLTETICPVLSCSVLFSSLHFTSLLFSSLHFTSLLFLFCSLLSLFHIPSSLLSLFSLIQFFLVDPQNAKKKIFCHSLTTKAPYNNWAFYNPFFLIAWVCIPTNK